MGKKTAAILALTALGGCSLWHSPPPVAVDSVAFAQQVARDDLSQMAMARVAVDRAASPDVRSFAQRILADDQARQQALEAVAAKNGIALPDKLEPTEQAKLDHLAAYRGAAFDIAFMDQMYSDQQTSFYAFEDAAKYGGALSAFGQDFLPATRSDLDLAKTVDVAVGGALVKQFPG